MSDERKPAGEEVHTDAVEHQVVQDLSVPMWVWTLLGFTLITAVIIVVIIWGGAKQPPAEGDGLDGGAVIEEVEFEEDAQTQPGEAVAE